MAPSVLDNLALEKQDPEGMYRHLERWTETFTEWWQRAEDFPIPAHYVKARNLVISGMGGSGQAGAILKELLQTSSRWPVELVRDYTLPRWVDHETLFIAVSYSGGTEETINTLLDAHAAGAKVLALTTGGTMASLCRKYQIPHFIHDYAAQPRVALPVHLAVLANFFCRLGELTVTEETRKEIGLRGTRLTQQYCPDTSVTSNPAKQVALEIADRLPIIIGSGPLAAVATRLKAQFNENAKAPAYAETLPEMNHNALVGTEYPKAVLDQLAWLLLDSAYTHEQNKNRALLTEKYLRDRRLWVRRLSFDGSDPLLEVIEATILGDWITYYTALLHRTDPTPVPGIAEFKKALER